jgi:hypothetical protein
MDKIVERIERDAGVPGLASLLAERLSPTDLQSILLEVYRIRSGRIKPSSVLSEFESNRSEVSEIIRQIPDWPNAKDLQVESLQGLTNVNYLVTVAGERFVVRW